MIRNLEYLKTLSSTENPAWGAKLYEALQDIDNQHKTVAQQVNGNSSGQPSAPPPIQGLNVTAQNGIFHVSITHNGDIYRGVNYHLEYADNPSFTNPIPIDIGSAREHRASLGNLNLHWRGCASYGISPPGPWVVFGGAKPIAVSGGGASGPPLPTQSQGSGTGVPGQGLQGPGQIPFRSATGAPPVRG